MSGRAQPLSLTEVKALQLFYNLGPLLPETKCYGHTSLVLDGTQLP